MTCCRNTHTHIYIYIYIYKIDKTETQVVFKSMQKKGITLKEIQEPMVQILAENSPSNATVKK